VPAYVVASYSNSIHTPGTFRGWRSIASREKWLRIHNIWNGRIYEEAYLNDLLRFFGPLPQGHRHAWEETPRVRYFAARLEGNDASTNRRGPSREDVSEAKYYLDAASLALSHRSARGRATASYDAQSEEGRLDSPSASTRRPTSSAIQVARRGGRLGRHGPVRFPPKLNADGEPLEQFNIAITAR